MIKFLLDPIPEEYTHLAPTFFGESRDAIRTMIRAAGIVYLSSLVLIGLVAGDPYREIPELIVLDTINICAGLSWVFLSRRLQELSSLYKLFLAGMVALLFTNMRESMLLEDFMSLFLIGLAGAFASALVPWPSLWTIRIQACIALSSLSLFTYWNTDLVGPLVTLLVLTFLSVTVQVLFTRQRWTSFVSRHRIETLNTELQIVNNQLKEHTDRLEQEMILARNIQQGLLPPASPNWPNLDVVCYSKPALEIGGDFYSYHILTRGEIIVAVGDVSGKGAAAALLMATSLSLFTSTLSHTYTPEERLALLDIDLLPYTKSQHQNCALCYVELYDSLLHIVNAGGIPPYIRRQGGDIEWPNVCGFALGQGIGAQLGYQETCVTLQPGEMVILTSDGLVEATNGDGEMFSFERLEEVIAQGPSSNAQAMLDHLLRELTAFANGSSPHDDVTIVVFQMKS